MKKPWLVREYKYWQDSENLSRSSESAVTVLFVQHITANLFCRWRVRRKTQSPWSLFRQSYGELSKMLISTLWWGSSSIFIASQSEISILIMCLCPPHPHPQAISDCWAESSSPPGGSRAHNAVWTRHLVQSSFNSLPVGMILYIMEHSCFWLGLL